MTKSPESQRPTTVSRLAGWGGYACVLIGIVIIALVLAAAGGGFEGWVTVGIIAGVVVFLLGAVLIAINFRRRRL
ncbi:hypothetical protein HCA61_20885 [Rhodococcus sp. HNM0563]|uniref:hypothetical protein n=1 Tax=unclassified Rhodococcus (in: high G+C Gram-positive bacteria) TaxID=192944 RepID=UPI00146DC6D6|nr:MULTISPECIES: hypothetical protein [unclassified Rhodococcus (in: high G+C Gram-positive bacteria)]MCK0090175.1 hypothetical protein [Rhodococcus sp. F64268]NLU64702.1 hypothetical protein [Rhodococcus sp. HNM0563]